MMWASKHLWGRIAPGSPILKVCDWIIHKCSVILDPIGVNIP